MPTNEYKRCPKCDRILPDTPVCPVCSSKQVRLREALKLLVSRVYDVKGYWTENLDTAMQQAEAELKLDPAAPLQLAATPPLTCNQFLEHARDSMDAALGELQEANKTCGGLASLLLLDMIRETGVMAARIRAILRAASNDATLAPNAPGADTVENWAGR